MRNPPVLLRPAAAAAAASSSESSSSNSSSSSSSNSSSVSSSGGQQQQLGPPLPALHHAGHHQQQPQQTQSLISSTPMCATTSSISSSSTSSSLHHSSSYSATLGGGISSSGVNGSCGGGHSYTISSSSAVNNLNANIITASSSTSSCSSSVRPAVVSSMASNTSASTSSCGNSSAAAAAAAAAAAMAAATAAAAAAAAAAATGFGPSSAFSGSAPSLAGPLLPSARRYVAVRLLTGETLQFDVEVKSKGKELYAAVARHMSSLGMKSCDIFGLAIQIDGEYLFVDPENKLGKYAPKGWKSSHASGLNNAGHPLLVLYFRVKFYIDSHLLIRDRVTRQHYYYQLRENVLRHGQPATEESFFRLAALALQAELGDYEPERHRGAYFDTQLYFPQWILERVGVDYVVQNMPAMHRDHRCLSTGSAQLLYIKEASSGQTHYGLHLYRLRNSKKTDDNHHHYRLRSAERIGCDSRFSNRTSGGGCAAAAVATTAVTSCSSSSSSAAPNATSSVAASSTSAGSIATLDRTKQKLDKLDQALSSNTSEANDSSGGNRTLERPTSYRSSSANENLPLPHHHHHLSDQQVHTNTVWLGICGRGIDIYEEEDSFTKTVRATFQWPNIGKLCFERKKFEIRAVGCPAENRKFTYYTSSDDKSKHLLYLCRVTHQFSMAMQPKLAELRKLEEEANRHYQESLGESSVMEPGWCDESTLERPTDRLSLRGYGSLSKSRGGGSGQSHGDQRISVISSTSSNTTSGIVSDKVQSVDESEDELDLDGGCPTRRAPTAAPSLESLALAHLRDSCDSLPAELERRGNDSAVQNHSAVNGQQNGNINSHSNSTTLPRRLAGLGARLARVGRSSNKATPVSSLSTPTPNDTSRNGSLHSSSSQHSSSTIHSTSLSKSRVAASANGTNSPWHACDMNSTTSTQEMVVKNNSSSSWLRLNTVDVTDGVASMRLSSQPEEQQQQNRSVANVPATEPSTGGVEEENQYWYSCDDDVSETGSTSGEKCPGGVLCADCRMGIVRCGDQQQHGDLPDHHHHHHHLHHTKGPSDSSSLCVSVDHTAQDSTLSDCQSYFHSHVSSVDSSLGGAVSSHPNHAIIPAPEMANTPLAATVSALSNGGSLRSLRSSKLGSAVEDATNVDYSVQSGPAGVDSSMNLGSPKLDFTVTSAVPNTGTYPRRSTVSNTLDSDSDYVTLPPLCPRGMTMENVNGPNSYIFMEPMQPKNGASVTVANVNQLSLRHCLNNNRTQEDAASSTYSAGSCSGMMNMMRPQSGLSNSASAAAAAAAASEAAARFITTRPTISILQAHAASTAPSTQPSFAAPAQHLIPPPPYDIRQHPLYHQTQVQQQQQQLQQQQQQQSYCPAQIQAQFQSMDPSPSCYQFVPPPAGYSSCQQADGFIIEPPPPPPPYPAHLQGQVQAPLTTANLGLHLSQQSVSSLVSKHSLNSMPSSSRSVEAVSDSRVVQPNNLAVYASEDVASLNESKTNGSSLYGVMTTDPETATPSSANAVASSIASAGNAPVAPVIGKNNYLDLHATNTLSRRPQQPIPTSAQQQQVQQQQQQQPSNGASVPYEQYHLGIPPPPQYPGINSNNNIKPAYSHVYSNQVTQSQIEQFKAQLYSDVDYVIYPHKDPSLSQQEYLDTKEAASFISSAASSTYSDQGQLVGDVGVYLPPPPPYRAPSTKSGASSIYRSSPTPNMPPLSSTGGIVLSSTTPASHPPLQHLGYGYHHGGARPASVHYASNQSLSSGNYSSSYSTSNYSSNYSAQVPMAYVPYPSKYLSCQSLASSHSSNPSANYSASNCYSASTISLTGSYEPVGAAIQYGAAQQMRSKLAPPVLSRVHSEESILTYDLPEVTTLSSAIARQGARGCILPPPPPYRKQSLDVPSTAGTSASTASTPSTSSVSDQQHVSYQADGKILPGQKTPLDIKTLREKSRNLDLPLISALCNDTTLLNQAKRKPNPAVSANGQLQPQQQQQQSSQQQHQPTQVSNIQSMPLPPTPIEAAQGKTTGQPPPKAGSQVNGQTHPYVMPRHPTSLSMSQTDTVPRRPPLQLQTVARRSAAAAHAAQSTRPTSWHVDGNNWNTTQIDNQSAMNGGNEKSNAPPPPLPPPNSNSAIEAKLQQLQKAAVAIATGPGSIIAEDGKIAKALNLPAFAKSVKNSYVVSPSRKHPVSGLYAVTELGKPPTGSRKIAPTTFSHQHNNSGTNNSTKLPMPNPSNSKTSFSVVP